ncbi:MAG: hypothetical protein HYW05_05090 [Candidatus Diapherotrites archaeon]|nr:hypothetical protein [Candidatus Diapherotrites archaeon]
MQSRKAQAALEYLSTYGFALVIIAVVAGVLIFMGIIKLPTASTCTGLGKFAYSDHTVDSNGNFVIYLLNGTGERITNVSAEAAEGLAGSCAPSSSAVNAADDFNIYCITGLSQGQTYSGNIKINYKTRRGAAHVEKAACTGTALFVPITIPNIPPQTALLYPNNGGDFWSNGPKMIIKFTVLDLDDSNPKADIYYSAQQGAKKTPIVQNLDLLSLAQSPQPDRNCSGGGDFSTAQTCYYDWNSYSIQTTGRYYLDLKVSDEASGAEDSSDNNFMLYKYIAKSAFAYGGGTDYVTGNMEALARSKERNILYFVYASGEFNDTSSEVYFIQSDDNGSTWSAPANISKNPIGAQMGSAYPTIAVDSNGFINVAWLHIYPPTFGWYTTFYSQCRQNCTSPSNWSAPIKFVFQSFRHDLAADSNTLYLVLDANPGVIYTTCSNDCNDLSNWSSQLSISTTSDNPQIAVNNNGTKHLTFWDGNILYKTCTTGCNNLNNWSADVNLSEGSNCYYGRFHQYMAQDNAGKIYVAFDCSWQGILYRSCASNCSNISNWSPLANITAVEGWMPSMSVDSDNNVYFFWHKWDSGDDLFYRHYNASTLSFDNIINLTNNNLGAAVARANQDAKAETGLNKLDVVWGVGPDASGDYNLVFFTRLLRGG